MWKLVLLKAAMKFPLHRPLPSCWSPAPIETSTCGRFHQPCWEDRRLSQTQLSSPYLAYRLVCVDEIHHIVGGIGHKIRHHWSSQASSSWWANHQDSSFHACTHQSGRSRVYHSIGCTGGWKLSIPAGANHLSHLLATQSKTCWHPEWQSTRSKWARWHLEDAFDTSASFSAALPPVEDHAGSGAELRSQQCKEDWTKHDQVDPSSSHRLASGPELVFPCHSQSPRFCGSLACLASCKHCSARSRCGSTTPKLWKARYSPAKLAGCRWHQIP